jgi:hypothetical protein
MMTTKNPYCSPHNPETTTNLVQRGAYVHGTAYGISIPTPGVYPFSPFTPIESRTDQASGKTRIPPVIWEARDELCRRKFFAIPVKGGSTIPVDIIAWDSRTIYFIAVRRIRGDASVREITTRYDKLINDLRAIRIPGITEVELWVSINHTFQVYEVLTGGLMSRRLP